MTVPIGSSFLLVAGVGIRLCMTMQIETGKCERPTEEIGVSKEH